MANFLKSVFQDRRECAKVQQNEGQRVLQTAKVEAKTKSGARIARQHSRRNTAYKR